MRNIIVSLAIAMAALPASAANSVKATVNGMVCAFCAQGIEKSIAKMDATKAVFVDLKSKVVLVEAKDGKTLDEKAIGAAIVDAGYDVVKMEPSTTSVDEMKAASKSAKK
ncbi:heavy-metal-associated domain-containing protein [Caenimonas sedimenti]|uniref:Heavy-metal-associated domain-containing protein n=1 Tax=Caenimonas sedimenti TaxID=2596921 RepID=A0A562ZX03_9BURK|nr:heavy-metal-associated domain-containing protein [Caenimonas sedimenti]TWO72993.1 heavy-metal-associated domain-containing protein [Caenimonas sedimenti]